MRREQIQIQERKEGERGLISRFQIPPNLPCRSHAVVLVSSCMEITGREDERARREGRHAGSPKAARHRPHSDGYGRRGTGRQGARKGVRGSSPVARQEGGRVGAGSRSGGGRERERERGGAGSRNKMGTNKEPGRATLAACVQVVRARLIRGDTLEEAQG